MSLGIDIDAVRRVKIAGEWFEVAWGEDERSTFYLDAYEYVCDSDEFCYLNGGQEKDAGVPGIGFGFKSVEHGGMIFGPISAIQVVHSGEPFRSSKGSGMGRT
jgi:hypothetical protein